MTMSDVVQPPTWGLTTMKQSKNAGQPQVPPKPLNPQQFPLHAQTEATPGRDKVREVVPVRAPRESKRAAEGAAKGRTGN